MSDSELIAQAQFTPQTGPEKGARVEVHFNPVSLQYTVTNTLENKGSGNNKKQFVTQSTGKLTMDLIFDNTHDGQDVRVMTEKIARFMEPDVKKIPAVILFEWGAYKFQGMIESYKETLDFFAPGGIPLRASVNLTLSRQDKVFEKAGTRNFKMPEDDLTPDTVVVPTAPGGGPRNSAAGLSSQLGAPDAARALAAANGQESLRFSAGAALSVGGSVSLGPPVAFASAGASAGFGIGATAGAGVGAGAGLSLGASAGGGIGLGISAGASASGSAGVSASAGAFAGLRAPTATLSAGAKLDTQGLLPTSQSARLATDNGATFKVGGKASIEGSASLSADVGASATLRSRIQFDGG
jgi:hypothetical protein